MIENARLLRSCSKCSAMVSGAALPCTSPSAAILSSSPLPTSNLRSASFPCSTRATEMIVLSCSRGVRDLLKSSSCCAMGRSIALLPATMVTSRHRLPHSISGETFWYISNGVSKPFFAGLLALFAREAGAGRDRIIVLGLDNAGWHTAPNLVCRGLRLATCPRTRPSFSPRAPLACRAARTSTSRPSPIWSASLQTVAEASMVISSVSGQTSTGGPSQPPRANQPEIVKRVFEDG